MRLNSLKLAVCTIGVQLSQGMASELENVLPHGKRARLESMELHSTRRPYTKGRLDLHMVSPSLQ